MLTIEELLQLLLLLWLLLINYSICSQHSCQKAFILGKFSCLKWFKTADLGNAQRICFSYITMSWGLTKWLLYWLMPWTGIWTSSLLAPPSLFETRVFVDGHDAWVLGKECVDYLERGPRRRRSAVRVFLGSTVAPRSSNWRLQTTESLGSFTSAHVGLLFIKQHCHHPIFWH